MLGSQSPHINAVEMAAKKSALKINVHVDTKQMAELMSQADLAIGASGSSSWERCALGLPSISYVIADNQINIALALENSRAAITIQGIDELVAKLTTAISNLKNMSIEASLVCDGLGVKRVSNFLKAS